MTWKPGGLLLARPAYGRPPFFFFFLSPGCVLSPFRCSREMALGFFLTESREIRLLQLRPSSLWKQGNFRLPKGLHCLARSRPMTYQRGYACVGIPAEKRKHTNDEVAPGHLMPRPLCFLTSPFEREFYIADSSEGQAKRREECLVLAYALLHPNSPAGPSPSPRLVPVLWASHIGYGKVRVNSSVIRWISQPSCSKISTFLGMA
ncbi:hypothetical protein QBC32DRAFT_28137 [Pseudoneurospora amorphoporcata]|uniref:Uncharacterized protein n=1 Tax=Pseudoneurospora amorphoporcata TaxID=241081 RepID=A0AAN6SJE2_9PEZI|nr:hypothetical protein QBC32DRAFT_28137 [Pseudoneurospora amorphoporcata]